MTCCLIVTLRLSSSRLLAMRLGPHWRAWLAAIAALELIAAGLLVRALLALTSPDGPAMGLMASTSNESLLALGLLLGAIAAAVAVLRLEASARPHAYVAFAAYAIAFLPVVRTAAAASHLVLMAQTMVLMVLAPVLLITAFAERRRGNHLGLALLAAGGYLSVLYLWHVPGPHDAAMSNLGWDWIRVATCAAIGVLFWSAARTNLPALLLAGGGSGLLGLALVVGPQPLFAMTPALPGLTTLADQRLAGLLMMIVDVVVVLPMASRLIQPTVARGNYSVT
jgi:putative membrane protein